MKFPRQIYVIRHNVTGRYYVGSSKEPKQRFANHMSMLRNGHHPVGDLQDDFNEFGEDFSFMLLDRIENIKEKGKEYEWMKRFNSFDREHGYNYKDREKQILHPDEYCRAKKKKVVIHPEREQLHRIVDILGDSQLTYLRAFAMKIFRIRESELDRTSRQAETA